MTTDDQLLDEFFEEERRRDERDAPLFFEFMAATPRQDAAHGAAPGPEHGTAPITAPTTGPARPWIGALAACAALALGVAWLRGRPADRPTKGGDTATAQVSAGVGTGASDDADAAEIDALCDAALAALDELESEARMLAATDTLLRPLDSDSD